MSGSFNVSGLISGMDTESFITQIMQLERQPITRLNSKIEALEEEQDALSALRTTLTTLRNRFQDFRLNSLFNQFTSASSETDVLTSSISGANPAAGSFEVNVTQLASASTAVSNSKLGANINPATALNSSGIAEEITAGSFTINGVTFNVDPATDTLNSILSQVNSSAAGVTATYNASTDKVTLANTAAGDTDIINLGGSDDDSNFLSVLSLTSATQYTNGSGSTELIGTRNLGAVDSGTELVNANFADGAVTAGSFSINGISIAVDPTTDSLSDIISRINNSDANVSASYDGTTDTIRVVSNTLGSRTISFGAAGDTSNFLSIVNLDTATQTAGKDAQFTINGGAVQTRNTNEVADAINGVTLSFLSTGASTVTVSVDDDAIVEDVQELLDAFNAAISELRSVTAKDGALDNDSSMTQIDSYLLSSIFSQVTGISGDFSSLLEIGISTGDDFSSTEVPALELDSEEFLEALRDDRDGVASLFTNDDETGILDTMFDYLDGITGYSGFLNVRSRSNGTIDQQIQGLNDQIDRVEDRLTQREERLRKQFTAMEQMMSNYSTQSSSLSILSSTLSYY